MSKPVSKTAIGAFVLGGALIIMALVIIMGSGKLFSEKKYCVSFFEGSVQGLSVGATVKFRGVDVGVVTKITLSTSMVEEDGKMVRKVYIPVYYEIYDQQLTSQELSGKEFDRVLSTLVKNGLRANMQMQSLITGQYFIQLDFYPNDNPIFIYQTMPNRTEMDNVTEIPAVTTGLAKLAKSLDQLPIEEMINRFNASFEGLENILSSDSTKTMVSKLGPIAANLEKAVDTLNENLAPTMEAIKKTSQNMEKSSEGMDKAVRELTTDLKDTLKALQNASNEVENFAAGDSPLGHDLSQTLRELQTLTFNLNALITILEQKPNALIFGN